VLRASRQISIGRHTRAHRRRNVRKYRASRRHLRRAGKSPCLPRRTHVAQKAQPARRGHHTKMSNEKFKNNKLQNEQDANHLKELLREAMPPVDNTEPRRDLWPQMLARLDHEQQPFTLRVPWFDWVLAAVLGAILLIFPGAIPALLYHL